jgi:hypothetical protein
VGVRNALRWRRWWLEVIREVLRVIVDQRRDGIELFSLRLPVPGGRHGRRRGRRFKLLDVLGLLDRLGFVDGLRLWRKFWDRRRDRLRLGR